MKRVYVLLVAALYALCMVGCSALPETISISTVAQTEESPAAATPAATVMPAATSAQTPAATPTPQPAAVLPEGLAVIADGNVCGGFLNGKWLTHREAARYLDMPVTFHAYNLLGEAEDVTSRGVSFSDDEYFGSWTADNPGSSGVYSLDITGWWGGDAYSYTADPLEYYYLYTVGPESLPEITVVQDTSEIEPVIQAMLGDYFGREAPEAKVIIAVRADIDGDDEQETVVNAANDEENVYEYYADKPMYCISCVIESDGEVAVIDAYYQDSETAVSHMDELESEYEEDIYEESDDIAFYSDVTFFYVQNIIDLNGDGVCEFVVVWEAYEAWDTIVYVYDNNVFNSVLSYGGGC